MIATTRIMVSALRHRYRPPFQKFPGSFDDILAASLAQLWTGKFFRAGLGHYRHFWIRDFGIALPGLLAAGHRDRALASLEFAFTAYRRINMVTTVVFSNGLASNLPGPALDSLGWLLASLRALDARALIEKCRDLLTRELARIKTTVLDNAGFPKHYLRSVGLRDHIRYQASCYDAAIAWRMADDAAALGLADLPRFSPDAFRRRYWTGDFYREDLVDPARWSAEANLVPFWFGLDTNADRFRAATAVIWHDGLDQPVPLAYARERHSREIWQVRLLTPNSHGTCRWPILGVVFAELLERFGDSRVADVRQRLRTAIERFGYFPELLTPAGELYQAPCYRSDAGMLWGSRLLKTA